MLMKRINARIASRRVRCILYTADAADEGLSLDLGGSGTIRKQKAITILRTTVDNSVTY